jgi:RHS repeat-associated protein
MADHRAEHGSQRNPASSAAQDSRATPAESSGSGPAAPPVPSLPKGGGAIHGIGEKFSANPVTGTASLQIPLALSPGRAGFQPDLALSYDSGAGNGPFGHGFHLSVPQIARKTDKGLPRYDDTIDSDVFLLSGAEDLVPKRLATSGWQKERFDDGADIVERYVPRIEGLFARIEKREQKATGVVYWQATTRDNVTSTYGLSASARIANPAHPRHIFCWQLEETRDDKGNVVTYEYKAEDLVNVPRTAPWEANRHGGDATIVNGYLKRIRYGNTVPFDASTALFEVVFDYGEHDHAAPTIEEVKPWPCRQDPFSTYRAGFEVRTYRLCRRVLMFHRIAELGITPCLVRSTDLTYAESPVLTQLVAAAHTGYIRDPNTLVYTNKSTPPIELGYSIPQIQTDIQILDSASVDDLPQGVQGPHQWIDLDGEGLPGVLSQQGGALFYKQNLGRGELAPARMLLRQPSLVHLGSGDQQLSDLDGDGRKELAIFTPGQAGYFDRTDEGGFEPLRLFTAQLRIDWADPNLRHIDLNGDGHEDVLITHDGTFTWYPSLAKDGFGPAITFNNPRDDEKGPALVFADGTQTIFLADMSGDGLTDLVRITNGSVCYWPNLGYGRFGAKVQMGGEMTFDHPESFDPRRIRLADVDGSGTTDVLYLHGDGVRIHENQAGNRLGPAIRLPLFPDQSDLSAIATIDLLGTGTGCLVWSSGLPGQPFRSIHYIDLLGSKKPYLLTSYKNNLGLQTVLEYGTSTRFYLADAVAGRPWVTRLPFPVHVLVRSEMYDAISRHRFVSTYAYHHGYFDGVEREFRGFGLVEQWDAESFSKFSGMGALPPPANASDPELHLPPVRTKTWFHTGAWVAAWKIARQYAHEYYQGDAKAALLPDAVLPSGLDADEVREACRALKGQILRQETYADDGSAEALHPYVASERSYEIRKLQPRADSASAVFFVHPREAIEYHYERNPSDPRITHALTLEVDEYGAARRSAAVGYPRRAAKVVYDEQKKVTITLTEADVVHHAPEMASGWYRVGVPVEARAYELTGLLPAADALFSFDEVHAAATGAAAIPYEALPDGSLQKRLLSQSRTLYANDDRTVPLPLGAIAWHALPWQSYSKAFTPALIASALGGRATDAILAEGGYVRFLAEDDAWWVPSGRAQFTGASSFFLPDTFFDPFGNTSTVVYDAYKLAVVQATDPLGNTVLADHDYRVLAPVQVTDANGNRASARFDELARVVATAIMGKVGDADGDTLAEPSTTFEYDLTRYQATGKPNVVHSRAREEHGAGNTRWQEAYSYSDGSGHEVMKKVPAESGLAPGRDDNGALVHDAQGKLLLSAASPRWVGTGRTVFDNKGNPVKQYEPFFSGTYEYEDETELVEWGFTPVLRYDPLGRLTRTDLPNGTFSKVVFDPWKQTTFDPNDNLAPLDPSDTTGESLWYQARKALDPVTDPEGRAAALAYTHRGTPGVAHLDALGRTFLTIEDNGAAGIYATRLTLDLEGNPLRITDARGNAAMEHIFAMGGRALWQRSCDAGERRMLTDVAGAPLRAWDQRGHTKRATYDAVRRATHAYVQQGMAAEQLVWRKVYGEAHPSAVALNLRGKAFQVYDGAGVATSTAYDFKGNLLTGTRRLAADYHSVPDWSDLAKLTDVAAITTAAEALLDAELFSSATAYDAFNRPTSMTSPDSSEIRPRYNEAGLLEKVEARVRGASAWTTFVDDINYDAKSQREKIVHGNGTTTKYAYDPQTFRLVRLKTVRDSDDEVLQNLAYTYDPVGNITEITDTAQQTVFFDNDVVSPSTQYVYDALYRLIEASGREHAGGIADVQRDQHDAPLMTLPHANDTAALRNYTESYLYDNVGNILSMRHDAGAVDWTRRYEIAATSNRLLSTSLPGDGPTATSYSATYSYDEHGSMTSMPHLPSMEWDNNDQMREVDLGGGGTAYYTYDAGGQRVRKVWEHSGLVEERIYFGGWEVYRKRDLRWNLLLERETLHGMDGAKRVVLVETKTVDVDAGGAFSVVSRFRFQLDNHLGSASLEVDESGLVIGYEEYHPHGTTAYSSGRGGGEVSGKRYRYTGKEEDEESGLYYHGARFYAPWLARWTSADPIWRGNLYAYVLNNPIGLHDPDGKQEQSAAARLWGGVRALGGALQMVGGAAVFVQVEVPVAAQAVGGVAMVHGYSDWEVGWRQVFSGRNERSAVEQIATGTASLVTKDKHKAEAFGTGVDIALGFVNPAGPVSGAPRLGVALTTTGHIVPTVVATTPHVAQALQGVRAGSALAHAGGAVHMMSSAGDGGNKGSDGSSKPSSGGAPKAGPVEPSSGAAAGAGGPSNAPRPSSVAARSAAAAASTAGKLAKELGGTTPIPKGTNLSFGFSKFLDKFSASQNAVSVFDAFDKKFLQVRLGDPEVLMGEFGRIVDTFIQNGGRIKFNLTGLEEGIKGVTTWELSQILGNKRWEAATDFFRNGQRLIGDALKEALKPWR